MADFLGFVVLACKGDWEALKSDVFGYRTVMLSRVHNPALGISSRALQVTVLDESAGGTGTLLAATAARTKKT